MLKKHKNSCASVYHENICVCVYIILFSFYNLFFCFFLFGVFGVFGVFVFVSLFGVFGFVSRVHSDRCGKIVFFWHVIWYTVEGKIS